MSDNLVIVEAMVLRKLLNLMNAEETGDFDQLMVIAHQLGYHETIRCVEHIRKMLTVLDTNQGGLI